MGFPTLNNNFTNFEVAFVDGGSTTSTAVERDRLQSTAFEPVRKRGGGRSQKSSIARCSNIVDGVRMLSTAVDRDRPRLRRQ